MTPPFGLATAPALGLAAAAKACNVSESTLRRKRPELLVAGATQTAKGWSIPIPALIELGLIDRTTLTPPDSPPVAAQEAVTAPATQSLRDPLLVALRAKLAEAEKRAAVAEAIAEERERIIAVQAQALRMLESPKMRAVARGAADDVVDLLDVPAAEERSKNVLNDHAQATPRRRRRQR